MTTIAYDGRSIAADTRTCFGSEPASLPTMKIHGVMAKVNGRKNAERMIVAHAGYATIAMAVLRHYLFDERTIGQLPPIPAGADRSCYTSILVCHLDRIEGVDPPVWLFPCYHVGEEGGIVEMTGQKFAFGSGGDYATGAMDAGATTETAIRLAMARNVHTGGDVVSIDLAEVHRQDFDFTFHSIKE